ncbi:iron-containing redox enzyme family protein [Pendulispora rubella]|uniref:Iron-containing redox enzyme family protein n=1 Tax=Pendulispora rubella TaxID=2741070 RepID=A0ABZ2LN24_9BACT
MAIVQIDASWEGILRPEWIRELDETSFLSRCREGRVSRAELHGFVRQQGYYSRNFTRFLNALIANLLDEADRQALMQNLFEEMGLGDVKSTPHSQIYRDMMKTMGIRFEDEAPHPATVRLVETMFACCHNENAMIGLGAICLGAEAIVPHVYSTVLAGFEAMGESKRHLEFFTLHVGCDDEHAITMRNIIVRRLQADPKSRVDLEYGAAKAIAARVAFFEALSSRERVAA